MTNEPGDPADDGTDATIDAAGDELLDRLRTAADRHDPAPADLTARAKAAFGGRDLDAELAELLFDSALTSAGTRRGASAESRQLSFQVDDGSIELDLADGRIAGQVVPPEPGAVTLLLPSGLGVSTVADDAGHFSFAAPAGGVVRIRAEVAGRPVTTDWFRLTP